MENGKLRKFIIKHQLILYFIIVLVISWSFWIPMALTKLGIVYFPIPAIIGSTIGAFSPLITIIIFEKLTKGEISLKKIFANFKPKKFQIPWFLVAAFGIPFSNVAGNVISIITGQNNESYILNPEIFAELGYWLFIIIPITFFATLLFSSPLGEEPGWRGFATSRLQSKFGINLGSLILGSFWWLWHQPINYVNGLEITLYSYFVMVLRSFMFDSVFNLSKKNILSAMVAHSSTFITTTYIFIDTSNWWPILILLLIVLSLRVIELNKKKQMNGLSPQNKLLES